MLRNLGIFCWLGLGIQPGQEAPGELLIKAWITDNLWSKSDILKCFLHEKCSFFISRSLLQNRVGRITYLICLRVLLALCTLVFPCLTRPTFPTWIMRPHGLVFTLNKVTYWMYNRFISLNFSNIFTLE